MNTTVLIVILVLLVLGLLFIIYSVKVAEVQEDFMDEELNEEAFSKPAGWKVGTMPKELQSAKKTHLVKRTSEKPDYGLEDIISKWKQEEVSKANKPE